MSWLAKPGKVFRPEREPEEIFVLGEARPDAPGEGPLATAAAILAAAEAKAAAIVQEGKTEAAAIVRRAGDEAASLRQAAESAGFANGARRAEDELRAYVALAQAAAQEGAAIRERVAGQAAAVVARAVAIAVRRVVSDIYEADPSRTARICADALRAASGQEILSIRVHPGVAESVRADLHGAAEYVRPDSGVAVGGCIVDLENGTIDATLDTRLTLIEAALANAGGEAAA